MKAATPYAAAEIAALLRPISAAKPTGRPLQGTPELRDLRMARGEDPGPRAARAGPVREPDWRSIAAQAQALLREHGKDAEVACRLAEAWVRLQGLEGLARGLALIAELVERYGDALSRQDGDAQAADWWAEVNARLKWLDLVLPPVLRAAGNAVSADWIRRQIELLQLGRDLLGRLRDGRRVHEPMARLHARLGELAGELDQLLERALAEQQWLEEQREKQRLINRLNAEQRQALREREQAVLALHGVIRWLQREQPDGVAGLLVERALRLMHAPPEELQQQIEGLGRWSGGDRLPYATVFDDPPAGQG